MLDFSEEELLKAYNKAKPIVIKIIDAAWVPNSIELIGKKKQLRVDKVGILVRLVAFVLLNLIPISQFAVVIESELAVTKKDAEDIAHEIDEFIFTRVRLEIREDGRKKQVENDVSSRVSAGSENKKTNNIAGTTVSKDKEIIVDPYRESIN